MMKDVFTRLGGVHPLRVSSEGFLSEKKIGEIEEYLGFTLPKDYREFLAAYGHVAFNNTIVFTPEEKTAIYPHNDETGLTNPEFLGSQVSHFFGADHDYTATLECKISPKIQMCLPAKSPNCSRIEYASSKACVGCS